MKTIMRAAAAATLLSGAALWAQGSGGTHGASPPIPFPGMDPTTKRIIQGGDLQPGRRAPRFYSTDLPGPLHVSVDASEPWPGGPRPSEAGMNRVLSAISELNARHAGGLSLPATVRIRLLTLGGLEGEWLSDTGYGIPPVGYDATTDEIIVGEALGSTAGEPQTPELSLAISLHEYGHALFLEGLERAVPSARDLRSLLRKSGDLRRQLDLAGARVHGGLACQLDPAQLYVVLNDPDLLNAELIRDRCKTWSGVRGQLRYVLSEIELNTTHKRINAYAELFSDLIAVVGTGKLSAMVDALSLPGLRDRQEYMARVRLRSLTECPTPAQAAIDPADPEDHGYFAPARCELGRIVSAGSAKVLQRVFGVLSGDLAESIALDRPKAPVADNERLIAKLRKEFL